MKLTNDDTNTPRARRLPQTTVALILAGGRGSRLQDLTNMRAKPAVYFGGKFRIIDFALSNCVNSGIRRIGVLTQYKSHSLLRHLQRGWSYLHGQLNEFVDLLPAQQRVNEAYWYRGTADAVSQNMDILRGYDPQYVLILAGDHVYKMDYSLMLQDHVQQGVGCTVGCVEVSKGEASAFGVMGIDSDRKILRFVEKPADPPTMPDNPDRVLASMGIYIFDAEYLYELLEADMASDTSDHDFGRDIMPIVVAAGRASAHPLRMSSVPPIQDGEPYWRDVGTVDAFWAANLDLASNMPTLNLYDSDWPIWTHQEQLPPAKFVPDASGFRGAIGNTLISGGCVIFGGELTYNVLFSNVRVYSYCRLEQAVVLPDTTIGEHCRLRKVVIDCGCKIPAGTVIGEDAELDARRFYRSDDGVVLVTHEMLERMAAAEAGTAPTGVAPVGQSC